MTRLGIIFGWVAALGLTAWGQTNGLTERAISLDECLEMALRNNFTLRIERHNVEQARFDLRRSQTAYDPQLVFGLTRAKNTALNQGFDLLGSRSESTSQNTADTLEYGISGLGPMGFEYSVPVRFTRSFGDAYRYNMLDFNTFTFVPVDYDEYSARFNFEMRQPLLRNFAVDGVRRTIQVNRKLLKMSEHLYEARLMEVMTLVELAYFELIFARENVKVQEQAVRLAEKLLDNNRKSFNVGNMAILEVHRAESLVASTRADLLAAQQLVKVQENVLKNLITKDLPEWKQVALMPAEPLMAVPQALDVRDSWRNGLSKRPDLAQARVDLERQDIDIRYFKNQTLPNLHLIGSYGRDALGTGFESTWSDLHFRNKAVDYYYGVELSFPWGRREAKYRLAQEKDQRLQKELILQKLQQDILVQIDDAIEAVKTSYDRIAATRQAAEFAQKVLQSEESLMRVGMSTSFQIMQFQKDLTAARSLEVRAITDYNKALALLAQAEGTTLERRKIKLQYK